MRDVFLTSGFLKDASMLSEELQEKVYDAIELFKDPHNDKRLEVHKLHGEFSGKYSFSVTRKVRIMYLKTKDAIYLLITVGGHQIYS